MNAGFSTGQHIGDYEVISILGAGGMGKVYKVRNVISERVEAMKVLLPDLTSKQSLADRFLREIRLLATLHHPNIAALRTALTFENQLVMIIEYVDGETLANRIARAPMSTAEVIKYADQCLSALSYAHKQNITHRDIKPANMMLTPDGVVKLMDFGIARSSVAKDGSLTSTGTTLGSLNYMPPEQVRGENADARSDIYSFGASLYEMLTGKLPFDSDSQYALMTAQLNTDPPPPITLRSDLPQALNQIIMMCMAKDPDRRFQSADALRAALKTVPVQPLPPSHTTAIPDQTPTATSSMPAAAAAYSTASSAETLVDSPQPPRPAAIPTPIPAQAQSPTVAQAAQPTQAAPPPIAVGYPPVPPPQPRPSSSSRGLWLAIGSLVGVSVLLAAGIYIPRHMGTHADPAASTDSPSAPSVPASTDSSTPSTPGAGSTSSSGSDSPVSIQAPGVGVSVDDKGNVAIKTPGGSISATADGDAQVSAPGASVSATKDGSASVTAGGASVRARGHNNASASATRAASQAALSQQPPPSAPAAVPPANPGPSAEEVQRITDDGEKLGVRADTVNEGLNALKQQQANSGYGLRADMVAAQQRMSLLLSKANNALQKGDTANAQKYFDQADTEISKLEKFLGH
jgi:eukaryotic-like serine/threonine-protein kinase